MVYQTTDIPQVLQNLFNELQIFATHYAHEPVATCEAAQKVIPNIQGAHCKNLFLTNEKKELFLVTLPESDRLDLKAFWQRYQTGRLSFASAETLQTVLGVAPGSVTPLALMNDINHKVTFFFDKEFEKYEYFVCHPLRNDRSTVIRLEDVYRFLNRVGHELRVCELPKKI